MDVRANIRWALVVMLRLVIVSVSRGSWARNVINAPIDGLLYQTQAAISAISAFITFWMIPMPYISSSILILLSLMLVFRFLI